MLTGDLNYMMIKREIPWFLFFGKVQVYGVKEV